MRTETKAEISTDRYAVFPDPGEYTEDGSKSSGTYGFRQRARRCSRPEIFVFSYLCTMWDPPPYAIMTMF